jgi:O-antigen/teichoic acid export membrane protein
MSRVAVPPADALGRPAANESFRAPVVRGLAWKSATRGTFEATRLLLAIVLARLLTPDEYGLAGFVLVVVAFEPVLSGVAFASALVRRPTLNEEDRSTVFWTCLLTGLLCTTVGVALSWAVADFYGDGRVQPLFAAICFCFVLSSLGITHSHVLVREMNFRALEMRAMVAVVVGAAAAIYAAAAGYGAWALVVQQLVTYGTSAVLLWVFSDWRPHLMYSRRSIRELRSFGGNVSGTLALFQLNQNTDNVLIGRFLGAPALGAYMLAYNIILVPFSRLTSPLHEVLYPVFARLQSDTARLGSLWLRSVRLVAAVALPSMLTLIVIAPDAVNVVFGDRWSEAEPVVQILAWVGMLFALQGLNSIVLQAVDRTRTLFLYALISFAAGLVSFVIGLTWGIVGVAACFAVASTLVQPLYLRVTARSLGIGVRDFGRAVWGVFQASVAVAVCVLLVRQLLMYAGVGTLPRLLICTAVAVAVYVPIGAWRAPDVVDELRRFQRRGVAPAS